MNRLNRESHLTETPHRAHLPPTTAALHGIVVLDFSHVIAGPFATHYLAALGARVIKVENPHRGDSMRRDPRAFESFNHGKEVVQIDLGTAAGRTSLLRNGDVLRGLVAGLAAQWAPDPAFLHWLQTHCVWANSLVDRIVSEALQPVGAVAEPYALWAIERQPGLRLPCLHEAIVLTDELALHERLKLFLLNAGHSFLAERWLQDRRAAGETVLQAMHDPALRSELEALWADEVLPVFTALGQRAAAALGRH